MKILHVSMCVEHYNDGWDYQDNLLPIYHQKIGHDVSLITNTLTYDVQKAKVVITTPREYQHNDIKISRLSFYNSSKIVRKIRLFKGFKKTLKRHKPDIIFMHGIHYLNIFTLKKFIKKRKIKLYVDGHEDFTNSARTFLSKLIHKTLWRYLAKSIEKYTSIYWGVLPERVDFIKSVYKITPTKVKLLEMGVDDDTLNKLNNEITLSKYKDIKGISQDKKIISTGGKFDKFKSETIEFIKSFNKIEQNDYQLLVFGSIESDYLEVYQKLFTAKNILFLGWLNREEIYKTVLVSDVCIFLGRHSVLWETAVACRKPIILTHNNYKDYYNINNNIYILKDIDETSTERLFFDLNQLDFLRRIQMNARDLKSERFYYSNIAKKSIEQ